MSFRAGLLSEKFRSQLPLYRQHQRLAHAGIRLSRAPLTPWVQRTADLWEPIYHALLSSILQRAVLAMDETPLKAGRREPGTLPRGYCWPLYGEQDAVAFPCAASRAGAVVREAVGTFGGVLVTDGSTVYERFAQTVNRRVPAQGWRQTRRHFVDAKGAAPALVTPALAFSGALSEQAALSRHRGLAADAQLVYRAGHAKPLVAAFFLGLQRTLTTQVLLPANPFSQAARYALEREQALRVFLAYPDVPLDTNHLEREICWTAVEARSVGIVQSLIASCRL